MMASSFWSSTRILRRALVGLARSEQHAVGHDDGSPAAGLEQAQEEREEEQLGLLGLDDLLQVLGGGLVVEAAGEGRIGEDQGVLLGVVVIGLGQRVPVADVGVLHAVQQHVHAADAQHGVVEVVAVEGALVEAAAGGGGLVDGVAVVLDEVLGGGDQEARRAAGRVADHVLGRGCGHVHHQLDDVARRAELPVLPGAWRSCRACTRRGRPWCRCRPCRCRRADRPRWPAHGAWAS